jgi:hypothetical protein
LRKTTEWSKYNLTAYAQTILSRPDILVAHFCCTAVLVSARNATKWAKNLRRTKMIIHQ